MIEVLPIHIANQIAAGEVVQRGASIVKELMENAVDAGASKIVVRVEGGGRTLVQVIDNGCGMSSEDASKSFLRHATSKIRSAEDLFALRTFGFRGEALASIASVAEVELTTRREEDEVATKIIVRDGVEISKEVCGAAVGTAITVRNLFYSVPARRKFLKGDAYETKVARTEFTRVAMINPEITFEYGDGSGEFPLILPAQNRLSRIVALTKPSYAKKLLPIDASSPLVSISGYVGTPDTAKVRGRAENYFFVNGRYFRNHRFQKAICMAFDRLIGASSAPTFFVFMTIDESNIDVNISPTKTEIRFEDEDLVVQILTSAVRQALGKFNIIEPIDFTPSEITIPSFNPQRPYTPPPPKYSSPKGYNPFENSEWDSNEIPEEFDEQKAHFDESFIMSKLREESNEEILEVERSYTSLQVVDGKYLVAEIEGGQGLMIINIARARHRVAYEDALRETHVVSSQLLAHPQSIELSMEQKIEAMENIELYRQSGFYFEDQGANSICVTSMPVGLEIEDLVLLIEDKEAVNIREKIAQLSTESILMQSPTMLSQIECSALIERLLSCAEPMYTPSGLKIIEIIEDIDKRFKR